jgi:ribosomal protein L11 methylase PrmA
VGKALEEGRPRAVVDLGTNTGRYAILAAAVAERVTAIDSDAACIDRLYDRIRRGEAPEKIQPLVIDLMDPTPSQGWDLVERPGWNRRVSGDFFLALALIHHLSIAGNVPLGEVLRFLRSVAAAGVVEFVAPEDRRARQLLRRRSAPPADYALDPFERELARHFRILDREVMPGETRILYRVGASSSA